MGFCAPNPYGNVGSLESSSGATISGSVDETEKIFGISFFWVPDSFVGFRILGEFFRSGLGSLYSCSTKITSESIELNDILQADCKFL